MTTRVAVGVLVSSREERGATGYRIKRKPALTSVWGVVDWSSYGGVGG